MVATTTGRGDFNPGNEVIVRTPGEILATLDDDGTLDGVPFMPEMLPYCGKRARVYRRIEKTCVEGYPQQRRFPANDVVTLERQRCSGEQHDGCKRGCMTFWKRAWLRPALQGESEIAVNDSELARLRDRLKVKRDPTHYFCQSTELGRATENFPGSYKRALLKVALRDVWFGNRTPLEMAALLIRFLKMRRAREKLGETEAQMVPGPNRRTPTRSLNLRPGDYVRVRPQPEIVATLDHRSRNRGLRFTSAMVASCGYEGEVRDRLDRMILETTGEMRDVENTVTVRGLECYCYYSFCACPRAELLYLREIWLERTEGHVRGRPRAGSPQRPQQVGS